MEDGLPHDYVTAIEQDADGFLLVGTDEGWARFDGKAFFETDSDHGLQLHRRWISALRRASDGSIWTGTFDGALLHIRDGKTLHQFSGLGSVFNVIDDTAGGIWASTRKGIVRVRGGKLDRLEELRRPPDSGWNVIARDPAGGLWAVTVDGLFRVRDGNVRRVLPAGTSYGDVLTVSVESSGAVWIGTSSGLFRLLPSSGTSFSLKRQAGVPGPVVHVLRDRDGILWAATSGKGLFRIRGENVDSWTSRQGLADDFLRILYEDREGNLWIGSRGGGLIRLNDSVFVPFGVPEGLEGNFASTVAEDAQGTLWLGTWRGGLYQFREGIARKMPLPLPTLFFTIRAMAFDRHGNPWIGNWEGLYRFDGRKWTHFGAELPYQHVSAIQFDRSGALWIGTSDNGLFRFPSGVPGPSQKPVLADQDITALYEDSRQNLWVGTPRGALRFRSGQFTSPAAFQGLPEDPVQSISEDSRGRIWAPTAGGRLCLMTPQRTVVLDRRNGLPPYALYRVVDDAAGHLWVSTSRGILRIRASEIDEMLDGKRNLLRVERFEREDGMRTVECHGLSQPAAVGTRDGSVWFATPKGFLRVPPQKPRMLAPPAVLIQSSTADGVPLPQADPALPPGTRRFEIRYTAARLSAPGQLRFRYRLEGFDPDWVTPTAERVAYYNHLPPGRYRFVVSATDGNSGWSETPAALEFRQLPAFYQTTWFVALLCLGAGSLIVLAVRSRVHILKTRHAAVIAERNRIAQEWHDTLMAGFAAISLQIEAAGSRLHTEPDRALNILDLTRQMVHHYRAEARRVIWDLRDIRPASETLEQAVASVFSQSTAGRSVQTSTEISGEAVPVAENVRHNLVRICQEAISNAVRHGNPKHLDVRISYKPDVLQVRISDDGTGFDAASGAAAGHFGLMVMQERARRLQGELRIESQPGRGTVIEAVIPLRNGTSG